MVDDAPTGAARHAPGAGSASPDGATTASGPQAPGAGAPAARTPASETGAGERSPAETTSPVSTSSASRVCPACGAPNSPRRELCGRCGADLETGIAAPRAAGDDGAAAPPPPPARRRWLAPTLIAVVVVALIVAGVSLAGLGPLAVGEDVPDASFPADAYGTPDQVLDVSDIATRTTLAEEGGRSYAPANLVDDDPATAWNSDGERLEDGEGEVIELTLAQPAWVAAIELHNGFQRDSDDYAANARIEQAGLLLDGGERYELSLLDLGLQAQRVELPEPVLTTVVRLEVDETFAGDVHPDLAVSELTPIGAPAEGEDVETARRRAELAPAGGEDPASPL